MDREIVLRHLEKDPVENVWPIQDLLLWPESTKVHASINEKGLSCVILSGHPATLRSPTVILRDEGGELPFLLSHLPARPFVIRETPVALEPMLRPLFPDARFFHEQRMEVDRASFRPLSHASVRRLGEEDAVAFAAFFGAPPHAAENFLGWLKGAVVLASFADGRIVAIGSTMAQTRTAWMLASIETLPAYRGRGHAKAVTSALTELALREVPYSTLTVRIDNVPAIRAYSRLGYVKKSERVWVDNGADFAP